MAIFRTANLVGSNLAPPRSLKAKIDWMQPDKSQPVVNTIEEHQLIEINNHGGGNCFFACIAQAVYGHEKYHFRVRSEVMRFYTQTMVPGYDNLTVQEQSSIMYGFQEFSVTVPRPTDFAKFVKGWVNKVGIAGECCSEVDMMVAAFIYRIQIIVLKYSYRKKYMYGENGVVLTNSQNQIQTKYEGAMGTFIIDALTRNFMKLLSPSEQQEQRVSAKIEPIMIYNKYHPGIIKDVLSSTPQSKYDEGGHYTLLKNALEKKVTLPSDVNHQEGGILEFSNDLAHAKCDEWFQKNTDSQNRRRMASEASALAANQKKSSSPEPLKIGETVVKVQYEHRMKISSLLEDIERQTKKLQVINQQRQERRMNIETNLERSLRARLTHMTELTTLEVSLVTSAVLSSENLTKVRVMEKLIADDTTLITFYKNLSKDDTEKESKIREYLCTKEQQLQHAMNSAERGLC
jgi:hypothetical protein